MKGKRMKQIRMFTIVVALLFATGTFAQAGKSHDDSINKSSGQGVPTVEVQLKVLTEKLDLTGDQQARITPILQELHDSTQKIVQDKSLSREERLGKVRPQRYKANKQIREILNDDQKKKLDQYLQGPHSEVHGDLHG
jgi:hypothetical protein